jgi:hypothetical protein
VARRQVRVLEQQVALGAPDVDLIAQQVVGDSVGPVAVHDDQAKSGLLVRDHADRGGHRRLVQGRRRVRGGRGGVGRNASGVGALLDQPISRSVRRRVRRRDRGDLGQPLFHQAGPTVLAKQHVAGIQISAPPALDHVREGVCK